MSQPQQPTERIYVTSPSWTPVLAATGLVFLVIGLFAWWPIAIAGALVLIPSLFAWLGANRRDIAAMPTQQHTDTAPIPLSGRE
jgi:hypothetical protein